jgi:hypothetical protein
MAVMLLVLAAVPAFAADSGWRIIRDLQNSFYFFLAHGDRILAKAGVVAWGPNWDWAAVESKAVADQGVLSLTAPVQLGGKKVQMSLRAEMKDASTLSLRYRIEAAQDTPLTMIAFTLAPPEGSSLQTDVGGVAGIGGLKLPAGRGNHGSPASISFLAPGEPGPFIMRVSPALPVTTDGEVRLVMTRDVLHSGVVQASLTLTLPGPAGLLASAADIEALAPVVPQSDWFEFKPSWGSAPSVIGMENWLEAPAGLHGGVRMVKDQFQFADGKPVKFWGTNLSFGAVAPSKVDAKFTAGRFAKYGINAVRMHKFTGVGWAGIGDARTATKMEPLGLDRFDYFASQLAQRGIYYGWSHSFQYTVRSSDKARLSGYAELAKAGGNTYAVINWAEDVQDLMIETVVNLLKHRNRYSGKTYAEDPALAFIEVQNEDDIFFYTTADALKKFPTYRDQLYQRFARWLRAKYGSQEGLAKAWVGALNPGEVLDDGTVTLDGNPWFLGSDNLPRQKGGARQRLLDAAAFLHETQNQFYGKFVRAVRAAGYQGPLIGSPWQAPAMLPHYYNLKSDWLVGAIDRHDYFGGRISDTMLGTPGGGYLSAGNQQVADRPFSLSEWITTYPSLYSAEGPLLVAAYGMGLQGWDASYQFQSTSDRPGNIVGELPYGIWNADAPNQLGQYPLLSRMVQRGDVREGPVLATRRVSSANLDSGLFDFTDTLVQDGDFKTFSGTVPSELLAMGRSVVEFLPETKPSTPGDPAPYRNGGDIVSATGQLFWNAVDRLVQVNTAGTQGMVGFGKGRRIALGDMIIQTTTEYALILAVALSPDKSLKTDDRVLVTLLARNANKGFRIFSLDQKTVVDNGSAPILVEPVRADITFPGRTIREVRVLDQDGMPTDRMLPVVDRHLASFDTGRDRTIYYLVSF